MYTYDKMDSLAHYFKSGETEGEADIFDEIFVTPTIINKALDFTVKSHQIVLAQMGVGKSALINAISKSVLAQDCIAIKIDPKKIECGKIYTANTIADKVREAERQILNHVALEIRDTIKIANLGAETAIVKFADSLDPSGADWLSHLSDIMSSAVSGEISAWAKAIISKHKIPVSSKKLISSLDRYLTKNNTKILLLLDDVEKAAQKTDSTENYDVSWALIDAVIGLSNENTMINACISVRQDI